MIISPQVLTDTDRRLESGLVWGLKLWHVALLSTGLGLALVTAICCLVKIRCTD